MTAMTPPRSLGPLRRAESSRARAGAQAEELGARIKQLEEEARTIEKDKVCAPRRRFTAKSRVLRRAAFCEEPRSAKSRVLRRTAHLPSAAGKRNDAVRRRSQVANAETRRRLAEESTRVEVLPPALEPSSASPCCRRDETCPVTTEGGTRRVQLVREGTGGVRGCSVPRAPPAPPVGSGK